MRGEDPLFKASTSVKLETPPRAWGRQKAPWVGWSYSRNTPTCVGKTNAVKKTITNCLETPPRAWGRRVCDEHVQGRIGNTPTCVGKTSQRLWHCTVLWKHPHVRGEDVLPAPRPRQSAETPPRAWGRLPVLLLPRCAIGNTPTCVGKTLRDYSLFLLSRQNNIEVSSFSDTSCSPDNSMSWRFGSPMP